MLQAVPMPFASLLIAPHVGQSAKALATRTIRNIRVPA
jgi:hypothetical protein